MRNAIIAIASAMILSTSAYAQTATSTTAVKEVYVAAKPMDVLSSNLIGLDIHNGAKEKIGEVTGDESTENEGRADQAKADLKGAGEKVKDAFNR